MPHDDKPTDIDPVAQKIIRRKARQLERRGGFTHGDLSDLEQDLSLHLLKRMPTFDPHRSDWPVFVAAVVTAWGINFLPTRHAAKRDSYRTRPLLTASELDERENQTAGEMFDEEAHDSRLGRHRLNDQEQRELQLDVREALQRLPARLRPIAERLQHRTIAELTRELGVPRTSLYELVERIRGRFQRMGLKQYR